MPAAAMRPPPRQGAGKTCVDSRVTSLAAENRANPFNLPQAKVGGMNEGE
jgi:hypothetical protein